MTEGMLYGFLGLLLALLVGWLVYRRIRARDHLYQMLDDISFERLEALVLPNGDDGEIQIDHVVLTAKGLLVIHLKEVIGTVFGSDKMERWTVIAPDRRYTFRNPQPALYDRIAAVRAVVKDVPVTGRIVFLDGATFSKGVPAMVASIDEMSSEFIEADISAATRKVDAFRPHWDKLASRRSKQN